MYPIFAFSALSQKRIDLKSMLGVYVVMAVGVGLAFMALVAEILWKKRAAKLKMIKFKRFVIFYDDDDDDNFLFSSSLVHADLFTIQFPKFCDLDLIVKTI